MSFVSSKELAYNPVAKPEDPKEMWDLYYKSWEDQIRGKNIKVYEEHCSAKLRACLVGDPFSVYYPKMTVEMEALLKDNSPELIELWGKNGNQAIRDLDPELYEGICSNIEDRDRKYEQAGLTVIRNKVGWYPDEIVDFNAAEGGTKYLSIYNGAVWQMARNALLITQCAGPTKPAEPAARAATVALIEEDPNAFMAPFINREPNPTSAMGFAGLDLCDFRQMPNKTILFNYGAASEAAIQQVCANGEGAPAGWPRGRDLFMRLLSELGFKAETMWFDSNLTYHQDCFMMNLEDGICGLPGDHKMGKWGDTLPDCIKDWEILPLPLEDIARGVANSTTLGDGRIFMDSSCTKTMQMLEKKGYEPIPIDYQNCWQTFHSGIDCSDANIWREND
ncbi:hypothetical protein [Paraferrimonas sedimenticola]|uniref:Uncharacterized protein n=1 Tax=Paraferrimonas sedimenticola TaxID=375674 RepID=A0AA37RW08_9GAMM|nr:hypothetical protein [Paraferrimonas sedimenticola]GLP96226.1 hypothetical protein GCM10007895_15320 [Paraferrimonas sedimenticola]